jgi:hypothetical protein
MIESKVLIDVLLAYRKRLLNQGFTAKAAAVSHCISIVTKLAS